MALAALGMPGAVWRRMVRIRIIEGVFLGGYRLPTQPAVEVAVSRVPCSGEIVAVPGGFMRVETVVHLQAMERPVLADDWGARAELWGVRIVSRSAAEIAELLKGSAS